MVLFRSSSALPRSLPTTTLIQLLSSISHYLVKIFLFLTVRPVWCLARRFGPPRSVLSSVGTSSSSSPIRFLLLLSEFKTVSLWERSSSSRRSKTTRPRSNKLSRSGWPRSVPQSLPPHCERDRLPFQRASKKHGQTVARRLYPVGCNRDHFYFQFYFFFVDRHLLTN